MITMQKFVCPANCNHGQSLVLLCLLMNLYYSLPMSIDARNAQEENMPEANFHHASKRALILTTESAKWPNAEVPYTFESDFSEEELAAIYSAMDGWSKGTCIRFVEWTDEPDYVAITKIMSGCNSDVGKQGTGRQTLELDKSCMAVPGNIMHELGHVLGFYHEHNRIDRDKYITILWENIIPGLYHLFQEINTETSYKDMPYDYGSIMHYTLDAYSFKGKNTLELLLPYNGTVGQRVKPSRQDIEMANILYDCDIEDILEEDIELSNNSTSIPYEPSSHSPQLTSLSFASAMFVSSMFNVVTTDTLSYSPQQTPLTEPRPTTTEPHPTTVVPTNDHHHHTDTNTRTKLSQRDIAQPSEQYLTTLYSTDTSTNTSLYSTGTVTLLPHNITSTITPAATLHHTNIVDITTSVPSNINYWPQPTPPYSFISGQMVALKTSLHPENLHYWLSCGPVRCFLRRCPGASFPQHRMEECTFSIMIIEKLGGGSSLITIGDRVVLRPLDNREAIVACGRKGVCKPRTTCHDVERDCPQHVINLQSRRFPSLRHADNVTLSFDDGSWLGCDPLNTTVCKRRRCDSDTPSDECYEEFLLFKL